MFLTVGGNRKAWRKPIHAHGVYANSAQKDRQVGTQPSCCKTRVLTSGSNPSALSSWTEVDENILTQTTLIPGL